jgi:hypothetical protein
MSRRNRTTIVLIALSLMAITAMTAQARPMASGIGPNEGLELGIRGQTSDRAYPEWAMQMEAPYWFSKSDTVLAPDDLSFSRPEPVATTLVVSDDGRNVDFNGYTVTGFVIVLLLAMGTGLGAGVWYSRKSRLSPA